MAVKTNAKGEIESVVSPKVRLSYPELFEAKPNDMGRMQFSVRLLIPKPETVDDPAYKAELEAFLADVKKAAAQAAQAKWGANIPAGLKNPIKDGDGVMPQKGTPYSEECHGHFIINAQSGVKFPPAVVLSERDNLEPEKWKRAEPKDIYSGCYVRAALSTYAWGPNKGGNGVGLNLLTVQKLEDGEPLVGSSRRAEDYFESPAAGTGQQAGAMDPNDLFGD